MAAFVAAGVASAHGCGGTKTSTATAAANAAAVADSATEGGVTGGTTGGSSGGTASGSRSAGALRVVFMGTSLTAGYGLEQSEAYPALVQRKADSAGVPIVAVNAGVSGETSAGALRRIDWVVKQPTDVFVLETGANDGLRGQSVAQLERNVTEIIARVRRAHPDARVCLVQMEAISNLGAAYTRSFHEVYPRVAKATGATLLPFLLDRVAGEAELNQGDGVHPNERGEPIVAENVWRSLRPVLEQGAGAGAATARAARG